MAKRATAVKLVAPVKLDLGCGKNKAGPDWIGVDSRAFAGVDVVTNLFVRGMHQKTCASRDKGFKSVLGRESPPCDCDGGGFAPWDWNDESVDEARASHFVEHLDAAERIHFANELFRVLKPGSGAQIIVPHWNSCRAYGDLTHKWPPVSEFWFLYLNKAWREANAPHNDGYTCDFETVGGGYNPNPVFAQQGRSDDYIQFAMNFYREGAHDLIQVLRKPEAK